MSLVQRIGAWLFGATFIATGLVLTVFAHAEGAFLLVMVSVAFVLVGVRIFFNGCRRHRSTEQAAQSDPPEHR